MKIVLFYHSLLSDWNHGNAHFLRGVANEFRSRGHDVAVFEPIDSWSLRNLLSHYGDAPLKKFHAAYPHINSVRYDLNSFNLDDALADADIVVVHEWNDPGLVRLIGEHRAAGGNYRLFFHDTHHRMVTDPGAMSAYRLENYDGVLAYGEVLRDLYELSGCVRQAWTWHEAADTRIFRPIPAQQFKGDLVWIGNWGDGERTAELTEFLIEPSRALSLRTRVHGVRYPAEAVQLLEDADIDYAGWLPNFEAPIVFAEYKATVHIPRRPYTTMLPGIPTIRVFEALACGIPLVCSPWDDAEGLFTPGRDYLVARNGDEMTSHLRDLMNDADLAASLASRGLDVIRRKHTCAHRVNELLAICDALAKADSPEIPSAQPEESTQPA